ncbi:serine/threonine-protein kinase [Pseudoxanthomonas sp. PXM01]|uniref:serine/threonine-protein kinase n=1 Tax=Pseudoxanthomonas sp. PXM01 TaxID=2769295 RepID=UPI00178512D7|nr:serine/threonine-protein kinase [Pseudoxanthomonas sp. PXM01]MBD9470830.1 protein kinase [Pseudoxanthomonas sp. PXM01]
MSPAFARALALFDDCVAMSPAERATLLAGLLERDPDTHRALAALLASDKALEAGEHDSLPRIALDALSPGSSALMISDAADARVGSRLGPWRIERVLASGGMGTVYEAWRDDGQYQQRVALKCIRGELTSPRLVESFRREREALAALDHPGIATLFDGGVEPDGQPWFAMRYVHGAQIDAWCDARGAGLRRRVELLVQACDALAYAHERLVLHQDIKPSNLMVNDTGQVQMLDFGLTVSLASPEAVPRLAASDGYTAPEALAGALPAVTMDVWSMGILMYRLLGGVLPHASTRLLSTVLMQHEHRPSLMSHLAAQGASSTALARGFDTSGELARALSGDLDAIAARCIARDPGQRYPSIAALRDDLAAWLQQRPVQARAGGMAYRTGRLLQRHRLTASLVALALLVMAGSLGVIAWRERSAADETRSSLALSQVFEQMLGHATVSGLGDTPLSSRALLQDTERRVRALPLQEHPVVLARGLSMLARNYSVLGDYPRAVRLAQEAARLQGDDPAARATAQATLAALLNLHGKPREAQAAAREGLAVPDGADNATAHLQLLTELARSHWDLAEPDAARRALDEALALAGQHGRASSQAELLILRGYWSTRLARFAEADADLQRAIALAERDFPLVANDARRIRAQNLLLQDRVEEGQTIADDLLSDYRRRLGDAHPLVGRAWRVVANLQCAGGQLETCAASIEHAERIVRQHYGEQHPEFADVLRVRSLLGIFGRANESDGVALLRRAEALLTATYPERHETVLRVRNMLARRLILSNDIASRAATLDEAIALMERVHDAHERSHLPLQPLYRITLAQGLMLRAGDGDRARAQRLLELNECALKAYPPAYSMGFYNHYLLARVAYDEGDHTHADALLADLVAPLRQHLTTINNRFVLRNALMLRAMIALRADDRDHARALLADALAHVEATFEPGHQAIQRTRAQVQALDRTGTFALLD